MDRVAAVGATSGSVSALVLRFLSELSQPPHPFECPQCPELALLTSLQLGDFELHLPSLLAGLALGVLIGLVLDFIHLVRQSWKLWVQSKLHQLSRERGEPGVLQRAVS